MASATIKPKKQSFHATNVWNELVSSFRSKIELRKYRRNYFTQTYEQCFSSADAINCMINILKIHPNFETKQIEKHHAIRLLEKFYESKVFTDVIKTERKKTFVVENGIYQLLSKADENIFQSVLNTNKVPDQQIHSPQESSSSSSAMSDSWKQYFLERLEKYLLKTRNRHGGYLLHQIEQELKLIDGSQILSNLHNNMPTDPLTIAGQLVDWLPESMSIVINFPSSLDGRNLPDYPSFIFDLFEMVVDTFEMQKQYLSSSMTIFNLIIQLIANKGNPTTMETLYDRDDGRSVYCFPSEIYAGRSINNPYTTLKNRSCYTKQTSRVHRVDSYDYKKIPSHDDDKSYGLTNLRRKSLSSCDLFHVTSKTLSSPFDEIHNWLNNKYTTSTNQDKMSSDEFELIQLALIHLTTSNRQYIYVILYFLTKCIQNNEFCSSDTIKLRIYRSFTKLITINSDENTCFNTIFDCFIEYYGKLFDISMDTKKAVSRRLTKLKKENKPVNLTSVTTTNKKCPDDRQLRQTFKQLRVSRPLTYNEHLDNDVNSMPSTKFARKPFLHSPSHQSNEKTCLTTISTNSPRRRARSFEPRAHATTLFDKTINPFHKLRVILKRND